MSARFWVGGSGNWDAATTTHWSATSGGSGGASVPTSSDDVTFDTLSNATAYTVTVTATANCLSITVGNPLAGVVTIAGSSALNVSGNFSTATGVLWTKTGNLSFVATSGTKTITTNSVSIASVLVINGSGGTFQLADSITFTSTTITLTAGTFDTTTNSTTLTFTGQGLTINGAITFYNLTLTPSSPATFNFLSLAANITVSNLLTISDGATATNRVLVQSSVRGTTRTITAASISISNTDFMDITGAGASSWDMSAASGGSGDCGGNTMQALGASAFTASTTQHWTNASSGNWSDSANWTSRVPLPQDDVVMDKAFGTSQIVTVDMPRIGRSIDWTGATWTTSLTWNINSTAAFFGSLTLISGLTVSGSSNFNPSGRSSWSIDNKGVTIETGIQFFAVSGNYSLSGNLTLGTTKTLTITNGTFSTSASNYVIQAGGINVGTSGTLTLGSETDIISGTGGFTMNGTLNAGTSTIKFTDTSNSNASLGGVGGTAFNNLWFSRGSSTGSNRILSSNTFNEIKDTGTAAHSLKFSNGTTTTVNSFTVVGNGAGNEITINTDSGTSTYALVKSGGGTISSDYLNIQHSVATPSNTWYAGTHSTNNQGVATAGSGWLFTAPPVGFGMFF